MDLGLRGRVYVVTGGARGLGRATAEVLVAEGAQVVLSGRTESTLRDAAAALGSSASYVVGDNADADLPNRLVAHAAERHGRLDGALISVGGPLAKSVMETPDDAWTAAFESVFAGAVRVAKNVARQLQGNPGPERGTIAFVLSSSVKSPLAGLAISNGLRPGLAMVAKTLADELGPDGIRVNGLLPGRIDTERVRELDTNTGDAAAAKERTQASIPLGRYGQPPEFGRAAAFLLSPASSYVDGVMLPVDGGMLRML